MNRLVKYCLIIAAIAAVIVSTVAFAPKSTTPLDAAKKLADGTYSGITYEYQGKLADGKTDCTQFLVAVLQDYFGTSKIALNGQVAKRTRVELGDVTNSELADLVENLDPRTEGVQYALVSAGIGTAVADITEAKPGDLVQYWYYKGSTIYGHSAVISSVDGTKAQIFGAHQGGSTTKGTCVGIAKQAVDLGPQSGKWVYIVRAK